MCQILFVLPSQVSGPVGEWVLWKIWDIRNVHKIWVL